jgi:hypothetical protein
MGFSISHLIQAFVLFLNALVIINEKRVLNKLKKNAANNFNSNSGGFNGVIVYIASLQKIMRGLM